MEVGTTIIMDHLDVVHVMELEKSVCLQNNMPIGNYFDMNTTINEYLFDSNVSPMPVNLMIALSNKIELAVNLRQRIDGYMHVVNDITVEGLDGIKFNSGLPTELRMLRDRWLQLMKKLDELHELILSNMNKYLPVEHIKICCVEDQYDLKYGFDKRGHLVLTCTDGDNQFHEIGLDEDIELDE